MYSRIAGFLDAKYTNKSIFCSLSVRNGDQEQGSHYLVIGPPLAVMKA